jgi:DNA-binding CsgD family transcriptional regulator
MNRTSATGEYARVGAVLSALFANSDPDGQERWGQTVAHAVAVAVSAANAVLVVGFKHATAMYGKGLAEELNRNYGRPTPPDASPLFMHPHTGVWCRRVSIDHDGGAEPKFDGEPTDDGCYDAVGVTVDVGVPGARATVSCHHYPALSGDEVRRQTRLLELLRPAVAAGVRARIGAGRQQTALTRLVDAMDQGAALYSSDGTALHQNAVLTGLLAEHSDRDRLWRMMTAAALDAARAAQTPLIAIGGSLPPVPEVQHDLRAPGRRHRVRARILTPADGRAPGLIVVIVEREKAETASASALQKRFCLTERELDVTHLLSMGKSNADIAQALGISPYTARHHTESVLSKLGVRSRAEVPRVVLADAPAPASTHASLLARHSD